MSLFDETAIRQFVFNQAELWNAGERDAFFALYRSASPAGLTLEYVGKQTLCGEAAWAGMDHMWTTYREQVRLQLVECIVNGTEAAGYYRNRWHAAQKLSSGIEVYSFRDGALHVRIFH